MPLLRNLLTRVQQDRLLLALVLALPVLLWLAPTNLQTLFDLVEWHTVTALAGLMLLSRGLEDSGYLARLAVWLLSQNHSQRRLAAMLVLFAAAMSAVITNDVALFVLIPISLSLARLSGIPIGRLVILLALAVNAGSALTPIGNPQNLLLWQASGMSFVDFTLMMAPLALVLVGLLVGVSFISFPKEQPDLNAQPATPQRPQLFRWSLLGYLPFILAIEFGFGPVGALLILALYAVFYRQVIQGVDWWLLVVFILMFVDLGLLAQLPLMQTFAVALLSVPGEAFTAGAVLSQVLSNVPAAIFLQNFTDDWRALCWGVTVGGFGLAIGSLANLIALRLAKQRGLWKPFHLWSIPAFVVSLAIGAILLSILT